MLIGHTLRGCVDWNIISLKEKQTGRGHTLRGCVDWNVNSSSDVDVEYLSHPTWVCGLKQCQWKSFPAVQLSHPTWVCGLKHGCVIYINCMRSHTLRGCVDWNFKNKSYGKNKIVTPYVGVWIETYQYGFYKARPRSHPTWVCGLKHGCVIYINCMRSHTLRGCVDWNFDYLFYFCFHKVTPCVGIYGLEHCSLVGQVYGRTVSIRPLMYFSPGFWFCYDWKKHVQARMLIFCLFSFVVSPRWQYIGT